MQKPKVDMVSLCMSWEANCVTLRRYPLIFIKLTLSNPTFFAYMFSGCGSLRNCSSHLNFESLLFKSDHKITIMLTSRCLISPQNTKSKVPIQPFLSFAFLLGTGLIQNPEQFFRAFQGSTKPLFKDSYFSNIKFPFALSIYERFEVAFHQWSSFSTFDKNSHPTENIMQTTSV